MQTLLRTPLHARHVAAGARLVPFAGWEMPVQYEGVIPEHRAVRTDCGVFDVSHMGQFHVEGPNAHELLQSLLSNDLDQIGDGEAQYTLLTNERGGIVDDLIAYRIGAHHYLVVVNAGNREAGLRVDEGARDPRLRGARRLRRVRAARRPGPARRSSGSGLPEAKPFTHAMGEVDGVEVMVNRTGYTGEHGRRADVPGRGRGGALGRGRRARRRRPAGLGARDTLRLEVCYPLHGNDITPDTDAISAGLGWTCALEQGVHAASRSCGGSRRPARRRSSSPS